MEHRVTSNLKGSESVSNTYSNSDTRCIAKHIHGHLRFGLSVMVNQVMMVTKTFELMTSKQNIVAIELHNTVICMTKKPLEQNDSFYDDLSSVAAKGLCYQQVSVLFALVTHSPWVSSP